MSMFDSHQERELAEAFAPKGAPRPNHKAELERALALAFDARDKEPRRKSVKKSRVLRRVIFGAALAAVVGVAACAAPVDVDVELGRSLDVAYAKVDGAPEPKAIVDVVHGAGQFKEVAVRVEARGGQVNVHMEVWGEDVGEGALTQKLKSSLPALASAKITEAPLNETVRSTLGKKIGHELFDIDILNEKDAETARQKILAELAAKGVQGQVDVDVEQGEGKKKVRIEVRQGSEDCDPPAQAQ